MAPMALYAQMFSGEINTEWQWNTKEGNFNWVNMLRLDANIGLWRGGSVEAATYSAVKVKDNIGIEDWQFYSNIEVDNLILAFAVLGYMHSWEDKEANLFFGIRNMNEDYFISDLTSLFLSSSPGIFPTIAVSYNIANYPVSSVGIHFDKTWDNWTWKVSLYNGVGYNGWKKHDTPFTVRPKYDGVLGVTEVSYNWEKGHYFLGTAIHSKRFEGSDVDFVEDEERGHFVTHKQPSAAIWIYGEQQVWEGDDMELNIMAQYSQNTYHKSNCQKYAELGIAYSDEKSNRVGLSAQFAEYSKAFVSSDEKVFTKGYQRNEWSLEATYSRELIPNLTLQPSMQYIKNGNGNFGVMLARLQYAF